MLSEVSVNVTAEEFESAEGFGSIYKQFSLSDLPIINGEPIASDAVIFTTSAISTPSNVFSGIGYLTVVPKKRDKYLHGSDLFCLIVPMLQWQVQGSKPNGRDDQFIFSVGFMKASDMK